MQVLVKVATLGQDINGLPCPIYGEKWVDVVRRHPNGSIDVKTSNNRTTTIPDKDAKGWR